MSRPHQFPPFLYPLGKIVATFDPRNSTDRHLLIQGNVAYLQKSSSLRCTVRLSGIDAKRTGSQKSTRDRVYVTSRVFCSHIYVFMLSFSHMHVSAHSTSHLCSHKFTRFDDPALTNFSSLDPSLCVQTLCPLFCLLLKNLRSLSENLLL